MPARYLSARTGIPPLPSPETPHFSFLAPTTETQSGQLCDTATRAMCVLSSSPGRKTWPAVQYGHPCDTATRAISPAVQYGRARNVRPRQFPLTCGRIAQLARLHFIRWREETKMRQFPGPPFLSLVSYFEARAEEPPAHQLLLLQQFFDRVCNLCNTATRTIRPPVQCGQLCSMHTSSCCCSSP